MSSRILRTWTLEQINDGDIYARIFLGAELTMRDEEIERDQHGNIRVSNEWQLNLPSILYPHLAVGYSVTGVQDAVQNRIGNPTGPGTGNEGIEAGGRSSGPGTGRPDDPIDVDPEEPENPEEPDNPGELEEPVGPNTPFDPESGIDLLIAMVSGGEQDPCERKRFMTILEHRLGGRTTGILEEMENIHKCQHNPFHENVFGQREVYNFQSMPQSCKTMALVFAAWVAGIKNKMPSVLLTLNRSNEYERFNSEVPKFNALVKKCAKLMGFTDMDLVPIIRISKGEEGCESFNRHISTMKEGVPMVNKYVIPVLTFMANPKKLGDLREVMETISVYTGFDSTGKSAYAILIIDEAELTIKSEDGSTVLESSMNQSVPMDNAVGDSITDSFTTRINISATQQAFSIVDRPDNRERRFIQAVPSSNYSSLTTGPKEILRRECLSYDEMVENMLEHGGEVDRQGLVMASKKTRTKVDQQKEAFDCMAKRVDIDYDSKMGLFTCSWDGTGITVYTYCIYTAVKLRGTHTFTEKESVDGVEGLYRFKSNNCARDIVDDKLVTSKIRKDERIVDRTHIKSYPALMGFIDSLYPRDGEGVRIPPTGDEVFPCPLVYRTIVFAFCMTGRSIPVKAFTHAYPLTDMYGDFSDVSCRSESLIQAFGRICSVDTNNQRRTIWASESQIKKLTDAISELPFYHNLIREGRNLTVMNQEIQLRVNYTQDGVEITDPDSAFIEKHLLASRTGVCSGVKRLREETSGYADNRHIRIRENPMPQDPSWSQPGMLPIAVAVPIVNAVPVSGNRNVGPRLINLLNTAPDRTMSLDQIRIVDSTLGEEIESSHNRVPWRLVDLGILERVHPGVFRLVQPLDE